MDTGGGGVGAGMESSGPVNLMPLFGGGGVGTRDQGRSSNKKSATGRVLSSGINSSNTIGVGGAAGHTQKMGNGSVEGLVYNH